MFYPGGLHNHSEYSNLRLRDSINRVKDMLEYAGSLGHKVIGITEHETIANAVKVEKAYKEVKKKYPKRNVRMITIAPEYPDYLLGPLNHIENIEKFKVSVVSTNGKLEEVKLNKI